MAENRKRLINLHTSTANKKPSTKLSLGEIAVEHSSVEGAKLYVETNGTSPSESTLATFITSAATVNIVNNAVDKAVSGLTDIVDALTDIVITGATGDDIITATVNNPAKSANTLTITHKTVNNTQSGFKKLATDSYGHVTGGTAVTIGDVSGLTGFQTAVQTVETKLSTGSTGTGNIVKDITVSDHTITMTKGSITSGDVTDFADAVKANETKLSSGSTGSGNAVTNISVSGHQITFEKGKTFSEEGHEHVGEDITGGTVGIAYLPTATTVSSSSDDATVPTSKAVWDAIDGAITSSVNYKGAATELPSASTTGDLYVASTQIAIPAESSATGAAVTAETGDYIIARSEGEWDVIEKNLTGAVTSTGMTNDQIAVATGANTLKSVAATTLKVGSATTATNLDSAPSLAVSNTDKITVTAGNQTSGEFTVPFATSATTSVSATTATSATTAVSATTIPLAGVKDADDLKAIEALEGTSGVLNKTDANTWELKQVITTKSEYSAITSTTNGLLDASLVKEIIDENELATATAWNDLNTRATNLATSAQSLDIRVTALENKTVDLSSVASAVTVNGQTYEVSNGGVNIGSYLSASTQYVSAISQTENASAVTTTFIVTNPGSGSESSYDVVQDKIIDCGTY